jgi:hypothetical protein
MANVSFDLGEAAVCQRLSRATKLFRALYLLESGETITDASSLTSQAEARDRRLTLAIRSQPVHYSCTCLAYRCETDEKLLRTIYTRQGEM